MASSGFRQNIRRDMLQADLEYVKVNLGSDCGYFASSHKLNETFFNLVLSGV